MAVGTESNVVDFLGVTGHRVERFSGRYVPKRHSKVFVIRVRTTSRGESFSVRTEFEAVEVCLAWAGERAMRGPGCDVPESDREFGGIVKSGGDDGVPVGRERDAIDAFGGAELFVRWRYFRVAGETQRDGD